MAAIGACWASGSWAIPAWAADTWAGGVEVPVNLTPATGIVIPALPYTVTQDVHSAGTGLTYPVYYVYTPTASQVISVWGFGDLSTYTPTLTVLISSGTAVYAGITGYTQAPTYLSVQAGVTYWFLFTPNSGNPAPATLSLSVQAFTNTAIPLGSILIPDGTSNFPLAVLSSATALPLAYQISFPAGAQIAQVGPMLLTQNVANSNYRLYNGSFSLVASVAEYTGIQLGTDRTSRFYLGQDATGATPGLVKTASSTTGAIGATTWTVDTATGSLSPSRDNTILYYAEATSGAAIQRWNLIGNVALSDLAAGVGGSVVLALHVLGDGTVLALYRVAAGVTTQVIRYSAAGATLTTYSGQFADITEDDPHLAIASDDPASFWAWFKIAGGLSRFVNIRTSDGVILTTLEAYHFTAGHYDGALSATPGARFGHSSECAFVISAGPIPKPPPVKGRGRCKKVACVIPLVI